MTISSIIDISQNEMISTASINTAVAITYKALTAKRNIMMLAKQLGIRVLSFFSKLKQYMASLVFSHKFLYRIEEIDINTNQTIIYCRGTRTILKLSLQEAINTAAIVNHLPPIQACFLGYYYGKASREGKTKLSQQRTTNFLLHPSKNRYNIVALEHRHFKITYFDVQTQQEYTKPLIDLAQNNEFLDNLSPSQACYIGIWTGFAVAKHGPDILISKPAQIPFLRIVK